MSFYHKSLCTQKQGTDYDAVLTASICVGTKMLADGPFTSQSGNQILPWAQMILPVPCVYR